MATETTGTVHGSTITLDAPVPALDGRRVRVLVDSLPADEPASAASSVLAILAELGPWGGETEEELQTRLAHARRDGASRRVPPL